MKTQSKSKPRGVKGLYTLVELAAIAGCCTATLHHDIRKGRLIGVKSNGPGNPWLIPQGNAADYLENRKRNRR